MSQIIRKRASVLCIIVAVSSCLYVQSDAATDFALPVYTPVPVSVDGMSSHVINLNGTWRFNPDPPELLAEIILGEGEGWHDIEVPGEWVMQGFKVDKGKYAGYSRSFDVPAEWVGRCMKLRCDGIYSDAKIWINGKPAGTHLGGFTAFEIDVTGIVNFGQKNVINIAVRNNSIADKVVDGTSYATHELGGITRKIRLFAVPEVHVSSLYVSTLLDKECRDAEMQIDLELSNRKASVCRNAGIRFELIDPSGKPVQLNMAIHQVPAIEPGRSFAQSYKFPVRQPAKWDSEHPNLYVFRCSVEEGGKVREVVERRFGFTKVEVRGVEVYVNNRPVKLRGVGRHKVHPLYGRSLTPELSRRDVELLVDANANFVRTAHYPHTEEFLDACDELGIFVEKEAPVCWFKQGQAKEDFDYIKQAMAETLQFSRQHPSIIIWSVGNESRWAAGFEELVHLVRKVDTAKRPTIFNYPRQDRFRDPDICELGCYHYPGLRDYKKIVEGEKRPVLFDEYAHVGRWSNREKITDPGGSEIYGMDIDEIWTKVYEVPGVVGGCIWAMVDEVYMITDNIPQGYGYWGIVDGWRRPKPELWHVKKAYSPVKITVRYARIASGGKSVEIPVENRFNFTNLDEIDLQWEIGGKSGKVLANVPPRSKGVIVVNVEGMAGLEGKNLVLRCLDKQKRLIDIFSLTLTAKPESAEKTVVVSPVAAPRPVLAEKDGVIIVSDKGGGEDVVWELDKSTGLLKKGLLGGKVVLSGGPHMNITPLHEQKERLTVEENEALNTPYTVYRKGWKLERLDIGDDSGPVCVTVKGSYEGGAKVVYTYTFHGDGQVALGYDLTLPREVTAKELGLAFDVGLAHDTLTWDRKAQWTWYPDDHIGRPVGTARAFPDGSNCSEMRKLKIVQPPVNPTWPWSLDCTPFGSNDFRSTKRNIYKASLTDAQGNGIEVRSGGDQHFRSAVDGDVIKMHVSEYAGIGQRRRSPNQAVATSSAKGTVFLTLGKVQ